MKTRKIKILLIISSLYQGGAERVITYLASYLSNEKYEISLILYEKKGEYLDEIPNHIRIYDFGKRTSLDFIKLIFCTRKVITETKPDIVLSFLLYNNIVTGLAVCFLRRSFKIIFSERNYPPEYLRRVPFGWIKKWLIKITYRTADLIITNSISTKIALEKYYYLHPEKIKTIYNPIALNKVIEKSNEDICHPFFDENNSHVIISVGRLAEQKRFDRLLRVFSIVKKNNHRLFLIVIGDGKLRPQLCELAEKLNIHESVDFIGFKQNPWAWISKADIFVLSSDYEGFPNVLLEAMACETPIVSTDCLSGPSELITNGINGLLVPTQDEEEMAIAINELLSDEVLRRKFSSEGSKKIDEYRIDRILPQYESLFVTSSNL